MTLRTRKRAEPHVHTPDDGRGLRVVLVDGCKVEGAFFADTRRGIVHAYLQPPRINKWRKCARWQVLRGRVEVRGGIVPRETSEAAG